MRRTPSASAAAEHDARALDVGAVDLGRIARVQAVVGGAMKDLVAAGDPLPDRDGVGHVAGDPLHRQRRQQRGVARRPHQAAHAPPARRAARAPPGRRRSRSRPSRRRSRRGLHLPVVMVDGGRARPGSRSSASTWRQDGACASDQAWASRPIAASRAGSPAAPAARRPTPPASPPRTTSPVLPSTTNRSLPLPAATSSGRPELGGLEHGVRQLLDHRRLGAQVGRRVGARQRGRIQHARTASRDRRAA